jgi:hypothetical protein
MAVCRESFRDIAVPPLADRITGNFNVSSGHDIIKLKFAYEEFKQ